MVQRTPWTKASGLVNPPRIRQVWCGVPGARRGIESTWCGPLRVASSVATGRRRESFNQGVSDLLKKHIQCVCVCVCLLIYTYTVYIIRKIVRRIWASLTIDDCVTDCFQQTPKHKNLWKTTSKRIEAN